MNNVKSCPVCDKPTPLKSKVVLASYRDIPVQYTSRFYECSACSHVFSSVEDTIYNRRAIKEAYDGKVKGNSPTKVYTVADLKVKWGEVLTCSSESPVTVTRHGRPVVVVVDYEQYQRLLNQVLRAQRSYAT